MDFTEEAPKLSVEHFSRLTLTALLTNYWAISGMPHHTVITGKY